MTMISRNISILPLLKAKEKFEKSDLPFKVDIIDWNLWDKTFQHLILEEMTLLK